MHGASGLRADCGKIVVAVSDDIDPTNTNAVFWSMAYRANPVEDVHVVPHRSSGHGPKSGRVPNDSSLLIDATLKAPFPPLALPTREYMERARKIWDEIGLPALSPQPPWHGYTLGDWNDVWETYAKRAVTGGWEQSGKETFAQKRGGLDAGDAGARRRQARQGQRTLTFGIAAPRHCPTFRLAFKRKVRQTVPVSGVNRTRPCPTSRHFNSV